jgi:hypothetical protein
MRVVKVPSSIDKTIHINDRDTHGVALYQGDNQIRMSNADVLAFVDAVVQIATANNAATNTNGTAGNA